MVRHDQVVEECSYKQLDDQKAMRKEYAAVDRLVQRLGWGNVGLSYLSKSFPLAPIWS
jgi:hypothetical protein